MTLLQLKRIRRINRYIMECKLQKTSEREKEQCGINRYIMECKLIVLRSLPHETIELIDTLWNVNS